MSVQVDRRSKAKNNVLEKRRWLHIVHLYQLEFDRSLDTVLVNYILQYYRLQEKEILLFQSSGIITATLFWGSVKSKIWPRSRHIASQSLESCHCHSASHHFAPHEWSLHGRVYAAEWKKKTDSEKGRIKQMMLTPCCYLSTKRWGSQGRSRPHL